MPKCVWPGRSWLCTTAMPQPRPPRSFLLRRSRNLPFRERRNKKLLGGLGCGIAVVHSHDLPGQTHFGIARMERARFQCFGDRAHFDNWSVGSEQEIARNKRVGNGKDF